LQGNGAIHLIAFSSTKRFFCSETQANTVTVISIHIKTKNISDYPSLWFSEAMVYELSILFSTTI